MVTKLAGNAIVTVAASLLAFASANAAESPAFRLQGGTHFNLELAQHITSSQTPAGSPIYFRVVDDVLSQGRVLIRKGTVVEGRMQATSDRRMLGTSGAMNFGVRYVPAVDGQNVRVLASVARDGRDRDGAVVGWVIWWGVFGLMTKGVDAYAMHGARLDAEVLSDRLIVPGEKPNEAGGPLLNVVAATGHRYAGARNKLVSFSLERAPKAATLAFMLPGSLAPESATLAAVNGMPPPETPRAVSTAGGAIEFNAWDVIKYCDDGTNKLRLRALLPGNESLDVDYELPVKLERKVPK